MPSAHLLFYNCCIFSFKIHIPSALKLHFVEGPFLSVLIHHQIEGRKLVALPTAWWTKRQKVLCGGSRSALFSPPLWWLVSKVSKFQRLLSSAQAFFTSERDENASFFIDFYRFAESFL